jgi:hypothetical protein
MDKKVLISKFNTLLKGFGFRKLGTSWSKINDENALLIILRKSQWSNKYYLDVGVCFRKDEQGNFFTKPGSIDLSMAIEHLVPGLETTITDPALDLEISSDSSLSSLIDFLKTELPPYLEKMSSISGLVELYDKGYLKNAAIVQSGREIMGIVSDCPVQPYNKRNE